MSINSIDGWRMRRQTAIALCCAAGQVLLLRPFCHCGTGGSFIPASNETRERCE